MILRVVKIATAFLFFSSVLIPADGRADLGLRGSASLSYVKYDVAEEGKELLSGDSFVQNYSLSYRANNLYYRNQENYYNLMVGYDLINIDTTVTLPNTETDIKQSAGRLKYRGDVAYRFAGYPVRFRAYSHETADMYLPPVGRDIDALIDNPLIYNIQTYGKRTTTGFTLAFEPKNSRNPSLRALPSAFLDYEETIDKNSEGYYRIDNRMRKISVAGLNQQNNWLNYRIIDYEDYFRPDSNFVRQQFQIGHVNPKGKRLWSALTNWIEVSADGKLTTQTGADGLDEYDLNFMAAATRRTWAARTFMNYNRSLETDINRKDLTESARIPIYINGSYGPETDWYMRLSAERGDRILYSSANRNETSYANLVTLGATTFKRDYFNLAPSLSAKTSKGFGGTDVLDLLASVETNSTARYSRKLTLGGRLATKYRDEGGDSGSKSLDNVVDLRADYSPDRKIFYSFREMLMFGDATSSSYDPGQSGSEKYWGSFTTARAAWMPTAAFSTWLELLYEIQKNENSGNSDKMQLKHNLTYNIKSLTIRLDNRYIKTSNNLSRRQELVNNDNLLNNSSLNSGSSLDTTLKNSGDSIGSSLYDSSTLESRGDFQYRPDRYTDATLRYEYGVTDYDKSRTTRALVHQKYSYNFFTRSGEARNIATLSQEAGYERNFSYNYYSGTQYSKRYLLFSGRYSPLAKLSLHGSFRYQVEDPDSVVILYYNAGMNADFKLLSTSLDYSYAKRDSDNRIEKKLSAAVSRTF